MRIVHVEDIFYPEAGYQVNILAKCEAMEGHEVYIITCPMEFWDEQRKAFWGVENIEARDKQYEQESGVKVIRFPAYRKYSSRIIYKKGFSKFIDSLKPDILFIHAESSVVTFQYLIKLKKLKYPIILDSHSLEMAACNKLRKPFYAAYKKLFTPIIRKYQLKIIRTQDDDFLMRRLGIPEELAPFISFGSDTTIFHPDDDVKRKLRDELGIRQDAFVIVNTGKLTPAKGGSLFAEAVKKKFDTSREVVVITVGSPTSDSYGESVSNMLAESENRVIRIPTQRYYNLAKYYQVSDLCVFAKECSLSFYDAQACGLPVIVEDNGVNMARVTHHNGVAFHAGEVESLIEAIQKFIRMKPEAYEEYSNNSVNFIHEKYDYRYISIQYTKLMEDEVRRFVEKGNKWN